MGKYGTQLSHRRRRHEALTLENVRQTSPTQTDQNCHKGREKGSQSNHRETNRWSQEWRISQGRCSSGTKILPNPFNSQENQGTWTETILTTCTKNSRIHHPRNCFDSFGWCSPWKASCFLEAARLWFTFGNWTIQIERSPNATCLSNSCHRHLHQGRHFRCRSPRQRQRRLLQTRRCCQEDRRRNL